MYMKKLLLAFCLFSVMLSSLAIDEVDQKTRELQQLKQNRDKLKRERTSVIAKEKSVLAETKVIEKQLIDKEKDLRTHEFNLAKCEAEIEQLSRALAEAEFRSKQTQSLMLKRLKAMYKFGYEGRQLSYLRLLAGADSISDLMNKYKYMSAIASGDMMLMEKAVAEKTEIDQKKKQVEARREQILFYKSRTEKIRGEILGKRQTRQNTLAKLQKSKEQLTRTLSELEESVRELERLVEELRRNSPQIDIANTDFEKQRGKLSWPVSGKVIENSAASMKGVTIQARYGADIRCVTSGIVEYARWFDGVGFGQMVIVNHGNGYRTLYAHASELLVKKGDKVDKDQVIARVGDTGSIQGSILYFEIWKGTNAMSTRQWLR